MLEVSMQIKWPEKKSNPSLGTECLVRQGPGIVDEP